MWAFWVVGLLVFLAGAVVMWEVSATFGVIICFAGTLSIMLFFAKRPKFPVRVLIFQKRHGNVPRLIEDRAARFKNPGENTYEYKFKKTKETAKAASFENLYPYGKGELALFVSPAPNEFYPAVFKGNDIVPIDDDLQNWMVLRQKRARQRWQQQTSWEKYYPLIVIAVLGVIMLILISAFLQGIRPIIEEMTKTQQIGAEANKLMIDLLKEIKEGNAANPDFPPPPDVI